MLVWDPRMLAYDLGGYHPLHPLRWELTWALAESLGVLDGFTFTTPTPADDATLLSVHTTDYLDAVKAASAPGLGPDSTQFGHGLGTADDPVFPGMHDAAALIAGGSVTAARAIAAGEVDRAVNIAGGLHHAMPDRASGFCVYNDAALAIAALLDAGIERVAYIDVDVHHGDGVQAAFYGDPRVLTVSVHESPMTLFPGTGWPRETGRGAAEGTAVNLALPSGTGDAGWLRAFHAVVPSVVAAFRPQVLVTQHGADTHTEDPLADLRLTVDGQRASYQALRDLAETVTGGRWLALGGGGYSLVRVVPRAWTHLLGVVTDRDVDPARAIPTAWQDLARDRRPSIQPPTHMGDIEIGTDSGPSPSFERWQGHGDGPLDRAILQTRQEIFPLHGLDPVDPRD